MRKNDTRNLYISEAKFFGLKTYIRGKCRERKKGIRTRQSSTYTSNEVGLVC